MDNLIGRATIVMWSTDGSANWFLPWTWFTGALEPAGAVLSKPSPSRPHRWPMIRLPS
jgi:hypothetical protein